MIEINKNFSLARRSNMKAYKILEQQEYVLNWKHTVANHTKLQQHWKLMKMRILVGHNGVGQG